MVEINIEYEGQLHTRAIHAPSNSAIATDAPKDNMGRGEAFSPTDLLATSLGTCMVTSMGIVAQRDAIDITGTKVKVLKEMSPPPRRVARLIVTIESTANVTEEQKLKLENAAHTCPVKKSLHPDVIIETSFVWK